MNTDKIILPIFLIADLYKGSLVDIETFEPKTEPLPAVTLPQEVEEKKPVTKKIKFVGENHKNVTLVVHYSRSENVPKEDMTFLSNILKACQLLTTDIAIVNSGQQQVTYSTLKEELNPVHLLLFDVEPSVVGLPFKIPSFQIQNYDSSKIMCAPSLAQLNQTTPEGRVLKTAFWNSLKLFFNIT